MTTLAALVNISISISSEALFLADGDKISILESVPTLQSGRPIVRKGRNFMIKVRLRLELRSVVPFRTIGPAGYPVEAVVPVVREYKSVCFHWKWVVNFGCYCNHKFLLADNWNLAGYI